MAFWNVIFKITAFGYVTEMSTKSEYEWLKVTRSNQKWLQVTKNSTSDFNLDYKILLVATSDYERLWARLQLTKSEYEWLPATASYYMPQESKTLMHLE